MGGVNVEQAGRREKRVQVPRLVGEDEIKIVAFSFHCFSCLFLPGFDGFISRFFIFRCQDRRSLSLIQMLKVEVLIISPFSFITIMKREPVKETVSTLTNLTRFRARLLEVTWKDGQTCSISFILSFKQVLNASFTSSEGLKRVPLLVKRHLDAISTIFS